MSSRKLMRRFSSSISDLLSISRKDLCKDEEIIPLHNAVTMRNIIMVTNFIDSKSVWVDEPNSRGQTALHIAVSHGDIEISSILLKGGAYVDVVDQEGTSPCHIACENGMIDMLNLLIYYHANICSIDRTGKTPFDKACELGQEKMIETLLNIGLGKVTFGQKDLQHTASALHLAAGGGHVEVVSLLLHNNWNLNLTTTEGSALHIAARSGQTQVVRYLLKLGIDNTIKNEQGFTAYTWAKQNSGRNWKTYDEIRFLLKNYTKFSDAIAVEDYCGVKVNDLSLSRGDEVWVIEQNSSGFWKGIVFGKKGNSRSGLFHSSVVQLKVRKTKSTMNLGRNQNNGNQVSSFSRSISVASNPGAVGNQCHDINSNRFTQMTSFGRTSRNSNSRNTLTKSTSGTFSSNNYLVPVPGQPMYSSSSCLNPTRPENHFVSSGSSSSHSSSGFVDNVKCSTSASASSFPSVVQSTDYGCESAPSVFSVESGSGSLSSVVGLDDSVHHRSSNDIDVTGMINSGVPQAEVLANWLDSINMNAYLTVFLKQGYDLRTIARCTPADLLSVGIKNPDHRKKIINDIHSWNIVDNWPSVVPNNNLKDWLYSIALAEYIPIFEIQNVTVKDILDMTWEDFEDMGVKRLGHLKRFGLAIKKLKDHKRQGNNQYQPQKYLPGMQSSQHSYFSNSQPQKNIPPPPAPAVPLRSFKSDVSRNSDSLTYQNDWKSVSTISGGCAPHQSSFHSGQQPKSTSNLFLHDDAPIRLNLVATGKILSDISKLRKDEEEDDDGHELEHPKDCPPPPAPLHYKTSFQHLPSRSMSVSYDSVNGYQHFPGYEDNGTIRYSSRRTNDSVNVPTTLPPLLTDDLTGDNIDNGSHPPSIDDIIQDIQSSMSSVMTSPISH